MAVPTALPTKLTYKGVEYLPASPIIFTELKPIVTVTFDVADTTGYDVKVFDNPAYASGYFFQNTRTEEVQLTSLTYRVQLNVRSVTTKVEIKGYNTDGTGTSDTWTVSVDLATGNNESWQTLGATVLRATLLAELEAGELTTITEGAVNKIAWEGASEEWSQPYVITQIITGGDLNSSQVAYAEMLWRVVVHTESLPTAKTMQNAIHKALARATATVNFSGVTQTGEIEEVTPVTDRYQVGNVPLYVSGGIYRLRLAKG